MNRRLCLLCLSLQLLIQLPAISQVKESDLIRGLRAEALENQLQGNGERALSKYEQAVDMAQKLYGNNSPFVGELYYDMGVIAFNYHKFEPAESYLRESLRLNPSATSTKLQLAEVLQYRDKQEESLKVAQSVLSKQRGNSQARFLVANAYKNLGNNARSVQEFHFLATGSQVLSAIPTPKAATAATAKPAAKPADKPKPENKPKAIEKPKPAEKPKPEPKVEKPKPAPEKIKPPKQQEKPKPKPKPKAAPPKPVVVPTPVPIRAELEGDAKLLTKIPKKTAPKDEPKVTKPKVEPRPEPAEDDTPAPAAKPKPVDKPKPVKKTPGGFVPPPPPMPVMSMPVMTPPPAKKVEKPVPTEKPKPKPVVEKDEDPGENSSDPSFLLDWADTKGKKKK